jgi:membrane dipeptidase
MIEKIADLHADLLCYLANDSKKTAYDAAVRCSIPFLRKGNVALQVLPIFTETEPGSALKGSRQTDIFFQLPILYPEAFHFYAAKSSHTTELLLAIENASSFFEEDEPLEKGFNRLQNLLSQSKRPLYLSLTWNTENRFGGGAHTSIGLKPDGIRILEFLAEHSIALDFSHASDALIYEILNTMDQKRYNISLLASHSNVRTLMPVSRNLPDELIREIFQRKGLIGLNFYRPFIGESIENLGQHLEHLILLGGVEQICFGADFHFGDDMSPSYRKPVHETFFSNFSDSSCYGSLLSLWKSTYNLSDEILHNIAYGNLRRFIDSHY